MYIYFLVVYYKSSTPLSSNTNAKQKTNQFLYFSPVPNPSKFLAALFVLCFKMLTLYITSLSL